MVKATINLNDLEFVAYKNIDLESKWKEFPAIRMYLKVRKFDLSLPVFVTKNDTEITFFQNVINRTKSVIVVHPNPNILKQLTVSLKNDGHSVFGFRRVKDANLRLNKLIETNDQIDYVVAPTNLQVSFNFTYKEFLNKMFPKINVLTVDNNNYRDTINLTKFQKENKNA